MKYKATYISYFGDTLYENDTMLPVIRKAQEIKQISIDNGNPTPDIIVWNTETEIPTARIWIKNGGIYTQIL